MILAQFQSLYPSGCLIAELVKIDRGQYIVRATVQLEGVIRSTGMAAATTVEEAEDRARDRALMVLGIPAASPDAGELTAKNAVSSPTSSSSTEQIETPQKSTVAHIETHISPAPATDLSFPDDTQTPEISATQANNLELQIPVPLETVRETSTQEIENQPVADMDISATNTNIKPFPQRSSSKSPDSSTQKTTKKKKKSEPIIDQSDDIAKISVEMQRLNWTMEQGRDYLIRTYNKRSRHLLSEEELKDFLQYLESQPTPIDMLSDIDPLAGF